MSGEDVQRALGRIEGKLDGVLREQARISEYSLKTSARLGVVEQRVSGILGWAAGAGAIASILIVVLKEIFLG